MISFLLLAADTPILTRVIVFLIAEVVGVILWMVGRQNVKSRTARETGSRAAIMKATTGSSEMSGGMAALTGYSRMAAGVLAIVFGFVFLIFGAFLK